MSLRDATVRRLIADVPVGTFMICGIDSALITVIIQKVSDKQVQSFSIGFREKKRNEVELDYERRMLLNIMMYLIDKVLVKTDCVSMKCSLEVHDQLLDYRLGE